MWIRPVFGVAALGIAVIVAPSAARARQLPPEEPPAVPGTVLADPLEDQEDDSIAPERRDLFAASLLLGGARDERRVRDRPDAEDDVYVAGGSLRLGGRLSERTELVLEYEPEYDRFAERSELDSWHHVADARFEHRASRRARWSAGGSLVDSDDPARFLDDVLLLPPGTPYRQAGGWVGFEYRARSTGVRLDLGRVDIRIEPLDEFAELALDQSQDHATLGIDHDLGPRSGLFASYTHVRPDERRMATEPVGGEAPLPADEPIDQLAAGWRFEPTPRLGLLLSGGVLDDGLERSWIAAGQLERRGERTRLRLRYDRSAALLGGGSSALPPAVGVPEAALVRGGTTDSARIDFEIGTGGRVRWYQELRGARTTLAGSERVETLTARSRVSLRLVRAVDLVASVDYIDQEGGLLLDERRLRTLLGLRVALAGPSGEPGFLDDPDDRALLFRKEE